MILIYLLLESTSCPLYFCNNHLMHFQMANVCNRDPLKKSEINLLQKNCYKVYLKSTSKFDLTKIQNHSLNNVLAMYMKPNQYIVNCSLLLRDNICTKFHKALVQPQACCLRNKLYFTYILS